VPGTAIVKPSEVESQSLQPPESAFGSIALLDFTNNKPKTADNDSLIKDSRDISAEDQLANSLLPMDIKSLEKEIEKQVDVSPGLRKLESNFEPPPLNQPSSTPTFAAKSENAVKVENASTSNSDIYPPRKRHMSDPVLHTKDQAANNSQNPNNNNNTTTHQTTSNSQTSYPYENDSYDFDCQNYQRRPRSQSAGDRFDGRFKRRSMMGWGFGPYSSAFDPYPYSNLWRRQQRRYWAGFGAGRVDPYDLYMDWASGATGGYGPYWSAAAARMKRMMYPYYFGGWYGPWGPGFSQRSYWDDSRGYWGDERYGGGGYEEQEASDQSRYSSEVLDAYGRFVPDYVSFA
jgi:hypothetical protein